MLRRFLGGTDTEDGQVSDGSGKNSKRGTHDYDLGGRGGLSTTDEQKCGGHERGE